MRNLHLAATAVAATLVLACAPSSRPVAEAPRAVAAPAGIAADELRRDLFVFAADSFGGRETGTIYADKAAKWLAARLTTLGLEPGGDSGYYHRVPMRKTVITPGG